MRFMQKQKIQHARSVRFRPPRLNTRTGRVLITALAMTVAGGCVSLDTAAPQAATLVGVRGAAPETLAAGRALYIGRCAKCHAVEPVRNYTPAQWAEIMPDMAERTRLTTAETADLQAYVTAVLRQGGG
jgi:mono/diheme cytochrome c family protein